MTGEVKPCIRCGAQERHESGRCWPCKRAKDARLYAANPEKKYANNARWRVENPDKRRAQDDNWRANNPEKWRASIRTCITNKNTYQALLHLKAVFREINERTCHAAN